MDKIIKKLQKKLKKEKARNKILQDQAVEYHYDIVTLDRANFDLEQEITELRNRVKEYETLCRDGTKSAFETRLGEIMATVPRISEDTPEFYKNALRYMAEYLRALHRYADGDTKAVMDKVAFYKREVFETKEALQRIRKEKKRLVERVDTVRGEAEAFKGALEKSGL